MTKSFQSLIRRFGRDTRGSLMLGAALALPTLAVGAGTAIDVSHFYNLRGQAQSAADTAALATVKETALAGMNDKRLSDIAGSFVRTTLGASGNDAQITATISTRDATVKVDVTLPASGYFGRMTGLTSATIAVSATAKLMGNTKICLLALEATGNNAIDASKSAKVTAPECAFFSNSRHAGALSMKDDAKLTAQAICTAGGYTGTSINYAPMPRRDCPVIADPLASRPPPAAGNCDYTDRIVSSGTVIMKPGVYCGGLKVTKNSVVKFDPGIYVFRGSKLIVDGTATVEGTDVGFYFQDNNAQFDFGRDTTINLSAPISGPMAGILFYEDRSAPTGAKHRILSDNAHTLLGTIYLPRGTLFVDSNKPIAQRAAYTIIVANRIEMVSGPELFLNANYGGTVVPVPQGVGPIAGRAHLIK